MYTFTKKRFLTGFKYVDRACNFLEVFKQNRHWKAFGVLDYQFFRLYLASFSLKQFGWSWHHFKKTTFFSLNILEYEAKNVGHPPVEQVEIICKGKRMNRKIKLFRKTGEKKILVPLLIFNKMPLGQERKNRQRKASLTLKRWPLLSVISKRKKKTVFCFWDKMKKNCFLFFSYFFWQREEAFSLFSCQHYPASLQGKNQKTLVLFAERQSDCERVLFFVSCPSHAQRTTDQSFLAQKGQYAYFSGRLYASPMIKIRVLFLSKPVL